MPRGKYIRKIKTLRERLMSHVSVQPNGCWLWAGAITEHGYGRFGKSQRVHRVSYEIHVGEIPKGMDIDHTCHDPKICAGGRSCLHRRCVNPDHLGIATRKFNSSPERSTNRGARIATEIGSKLKREATHCKRGHEFTLENTRIQHGKFRLCIECARKSDRESARQRRRARKAAATAANQQPT